MIRFVEAVTDAKRKNKRLVFDLGGGVYAVVKIFSDEGNGRPRTAKLWDLKQSSYERTKSYWTTQTVVDATRQERDEAIALLVELCTHVTG